MKTISQKQKSSDTLFILVDQGKIHKKNVFTRHLKQIMDYASGIAEGKPSQNLAGNSRKCPFGDHHPMIFCKLWCHE